MERGVTVNRITSSAADWMDTVLDEVQKSMNIWKQKKPKVAFRPGHGWCDYVGDKL